MRITFVKKIAADGSPCRKCQDVESRLLASGVMSRIDRVAIADERDPTSAGWSLAARHGIERAPFFIVEDAAGKETVYTVYLQFIREVIGDANAAARTRVS